MIWTYGCFKKKRWRKSEGLGIPLVCTGREITLLAVNYSHVLTFFFIKTKLRNEEINLGNNVLNFKKILFILGIDGEKVKMSTRIKKNIIGRFF